MGPIESVPTSYFRSNAILDWVQKTPVKLFFFDLSYFFQKNITINFLSVRFIANLTTYPCDHSSQLSFDVYYVSVNLKLKIVVDHVWVKTILFTDSLHQEWKMHKIKKNEGYSFSISFFISI